MNVITILKQALIGKEMRVCVYFKVIHQYKTITSTSKKIRVRIGNHSKYETLTITDVTIDFDEHSDYPIAHLSNGLVAQLRFDDHIPLAYEKPE
jgi:hypothetical protein